MNALMTPFLRLSDAINRLAIGLCILCVLAMLGISFTGFLYTLFTDQALSWTYSLARLFLPWIGLLSSTVALYGGEHVAMTLLMKALPPMLVKAAAIASLAAIAVLGLALVWYGWDFFSNARQMYMVSASIQISYKWTAIAVPICGAIMLIHLSHGFRLLEHFTGEEAIIDEVLASNAEESTT